MEEIHHSECVCTMSTYSNVSIAGTQGENTVLGLGVGKCGMGTSAAKSPGMSRNFILTGEWSSCV